MTPLLCPKATRSKQLGAYALFSLYFVCCVCIRECQSLSLYLSVHSSIRVRPSDHLSICPSIRSSLHVTIGPSVCLSLPKFASVLGCVCVCVLSKERNMCESLCVWMSVFSWSVILLGQRIAIGQKPVGRRPPTWTPVERHCIGPVANHWNWSFGVCCPFLERSCT